MNVGTATGSDVTLFADVPEEELEEAFARLEVRRYPAGAVLIAEGDVLQELFILRSGSVEVFVADRQRAEHRVAQLASGATLGEMSLLTAQPAVSTVRAVEDAELLALSKEEFDRLAARFPQIYRNVGGILADRLARTNRLTLGEEPGRLSVLLDRGAPPELAYAIAASVAWHARVPTILLLLTDEPPERLTSIVHDIGDLRGRFPRNKSESADSRPNLSVKVLDPKLESRLGEILSELREEYDHVLLVVRTPPRANVSEIRTIELRASGGDDGGPRTSDYTVEAWAPGHTFVGPDPGGLIQVPALEPEDERALSKGVLPSSSAAGRKIGWIARDLAGLKVGIALGAGSARGFAHFGVLRALERLGVFPDCLAGTSTGAAAGALYALGHSPDKAAQIFLSGGPTLFRPRISTKSFLSNRRFSRFIHGVAEETLIEDLPYPFATVAADIDSQREIVFRRGLLWPAVVASISIPGIYPAQRMGPYTVVDGGVVNPVPCSVCADMGADTVIGVKLGARTREPDFQAESAPASGRPPSAIPTILRSIEIMQARLAPEAVEANAIIVTPEGRDLPTGSLRSFKEAVRFIPAGDAAAEAAMPRIAVALPWVRG